MKQLLFVLLVFNCFNINIFSQGKITTKSNADQLFGQILVSKQIATSSLESLTKRSSDVLMFNLLDNNIYVLDNNRNVLLPVGGTVNSSDIFSVYLIAVIQELISKGGSATTFIERRNEVLTITNGESTLEWSTLCPPFCY